MLWLDKFVQRELKQGHKIRGVRQKHSIKQDIQSPVAIHDVRKVSVLVA